MITSANAVVRFTPRELQDASGRPLPGAPVYLIDPPTLFTRSEWRRELADLGAKMVGAQALIVAMRRGINTVVAEDQRAELLSFVGEFEDSSASLAADIAEFETTIQGVETGEGDTAASNAALDRLNRHSALIERMEDLEAQMRRMYPPYARMLGEQTYWLETAPLVAARIFLKGGENVAVAVERRNGRIPTELLDALPAGHVQEIGWHAISLMNAIGADAKNSDGPSSSAESQARSTPAKRAPGRSSEKRSPKIRSKPSQAGVSK